MSRTGSIGGLSGDITSGSCLIEDLGIGSSSDSMVTTASFFSRSAFSANSFFSRSAFSANLR